MLGWLSRFQQPSARAWSPDVARHMRRIENYYLGATDIPPQVRRRVACRKLLELKPLTPQLAKITIAQWDDVARDRGIPIEQSRRYAGRTLMFRQSRPRHAQLAARQALQMLNSLQLGQMLQEAGLLSFRQVEAIVTLQVEDSTRRFGELAVQSGFLKQDTVDFFADRFPQLVRAPWRYPLGQYLRMAALLDDEQTSAILLEQGVRSARFGDIAVARGWVERQTVDWLLGYVRV